MNARVLRVKTRKSKLRTLDSIGRPLRAICVSKKSKFLTTLALCSVFFLASFFCTCLQSSILDGFSFLQATRRRSRPQLARLCAEKLKKRPKGRQLRSRVKMALFFAHFTTRGAEAQMFRVARRDLQVWWRASARLLHHRPPRDSPQQIFCLYVKLAEWIKSAPSIAASRRRVKAPSYRALITSRNRFFSAARLSASAPSWFRARIAGADRRSLASCRIVARAQKKTRVARQTSDRQTLIIVVVVVVD